MKSIDKICTKVVLSVGAVIAVTMAIYHVFVNDAFCAVCETILFAAAWYYQRDIHISDDNENR